MRKLIALLLALVPCAARAQTVVANFDSPACDGNGVKIYQGIDFSLSTWDCEKNTLPGDSSEMISWYTRINSGKFRFVTPSVLVSLMAGGSSSSGTLTISTDAGESKSWFLPLGLTIVTTGFTKPASVVTVTYSGGWTVEIDNIAYAPSAGNKMLSALNETISSNDSVGVVPAIPVVCQGIPENLTTSDAVAVLEVSGGGPSASSGSLAESLQEEDSASATHDAGSAMIEAVVAADSLTIVLGVSFPASCSLSIAGNVVSCTLAPR